MSEALRVGDRVEIFLGSKFWNSQGWVGGVVIKIEPYSRFRNFYWVRLNDDGEAILGHTNGLVSVLNPKNIRRIE
jgi:hypothetical protein